jgi:hypothetical protein
MFPPAGEGSRERAPLRRQLDAGMAEPLAVAPRFLVHVGLHLRPFASRRLSPALAQAAGESSHLQRRVPTLVSCRMGFGDGRGFTSRVKCVVQCKSSELQRTDHLHHDRLVVKGTYAQGCAGMERRECPRSDKLFCLSPIAARPGRSGYAHRIENFKNEIGKIEFSQI